MTSQLLGDRHAWVQNKCFFFSFFLLEVLLSFGECLNIHLRDDVGIQSLSPVCPGCFSFPARQLCPSTDREGIETFQPIDTYRQPLSCLPFLLPRSSRGHKRLSDECLAAWAQLKCI